LLTSFAGFEFSNGEAYWSGEELFQPGQRVILPIHELIPGQYMVGLLAYFDVMDGSLTAHAGTVDWFRSLPTGCEGVAPAEGMTSEFQNGTINRANTLPVCQPKD
jgi:hypothetical protein